MNGRTTASAARRAVVALLVATVAAALASCASNTEPPASTPLAPLEQLETPPIDLETMEWLTELQTTLYGDPALGAVAIDDSRTVVTITWHGEPSAQLQGFLDRAPAGIRVELQAAAFPPGELQELIAEVMGAQAVPGVQIAMGGVRNDGSGLEFGIVELPPGMTEEAVADRIAEVIQRDDIPITVTVSGAVMPLTG